MSSPFQEEVTAELEKARSKFGPMNSYHEGAAVIFEELNEFWEHARAWKGVREENREALQELVQIAAMAQRAAEDLGLIGR